MRSFCRSAHFATPQVNTLFKILRRIRARMAVAGSENSETVQRVDARAMAPGVASGKTGTGRQKARNARDGGKESGRDDSGPGRDVRQASCTIRPAAPVSTVHASA